MSLSSDIRALSRDMAAVKATVITPAYLLRSDRAAMRYTGHKSQWRFHLWAIKRGLKPVFKKNAQARTAYRVSDLKAACDADVAAQFPKGSKG